MVRSYLRHEPTSSFGVICSSSSNSLLDPDAKAAYVPALEDVLVWDVKRGALLSTWHETGFRSKVTAIARSPTTPNIFAVGYQDGSIRLWNADSSTSSVTFNGHKKAITHLAFDHQGLRLASSSLDTDVILWDIVAETGLYRLRGHRDAVTCVAFVHTPATEQQGSSSSSTANGIAASGSPGYLLSSSKDGLVKLWDLSLQHCVETIVPGQGEIVSLAVSQSIPLSMTSTDDEAPSADGGALVLTGSVEGEMRVWEISSTALVSGLSSNNTKFLIPRGSIPLAGSHRVTQIEFSPNFITVSSTDKGVQVFRLRTTAEVAKKIARRKKRAAEKNKAQPESDEVNWTDRIESYVSVRPGAGKLRSFSTVPTKGGLSVLCALGANALEVHSVPAPPKSKAEKAQIEPVLQAGLELPGHRADVRALALSSDDTLLASACGAGQLKIWNVKTGKCIRTLPCGYALCVAWLQGDQHVLVGCKDGTLRSFDVRAGVAVETVQAHEGPLWSIAMQPDGQGCVSASADKEVKFWEFEMTSEDSDEEGSDDDEEEEKDEQNKTEQLSLIHVRTLKMTDDVLCARFSPNGKLLALSLLDNTVKVFFSDSLKFFLSLYGHKLPVLSLDISMDSKLCVTVSADKNVKIWGLDFGDCHKSIYAHEESIMGVAFERGQQGGGLMGGREGDSHHFWTVGKDGGVKHWDGDRFELIQSLEGHHGEVWAVTPGSRGQMVVTAGADRSIRTWEKTDEPLFLEEEREQELERAYESAEQVREERPIGSLAEGADPNAVVTAEADGVTKATRETMMAGERLVEALDIADADIAARALAAKHNQPPPPFHALITAAFEGRDTDTISAQKYMLRVVEKILPAQLDDALLVLPFDRVLSLLKYLDLWARSEWNVSLVARILFFLLRTHQAQIVANRIMRPTLVSLRAHLRTALNRQKTTVGFNLAALRFIRAQHVAQKTSELYEKEGLDMDEDAVRARIEQGQARKRKLHVA